MRELPRTLVIQVAAIPMLAIAAVLGVVYLPDQSPVFQYVAVVIFSYLVGSLSWGYMLLRWRSGVDVRNFGSGRTGMSNVLRTGGGKAAAAVFALDVAKGLVVVIVARQVADAHLAEVAAALVACGATTWRCFHPGADGEPQALGAVPDDRSAQGCHRDIPGSQPRESYYPGSIVGCGPEPRRCVGLALADWYSANTHLNSPRSCAP